MRHVKGIIPHDLIVDEPCIVDAIVNGSIRVTATGELTFKGICNGRIEIEPGGCVQTDGIVNGGVRHMPGTAAE